MPVITLPDGSQRSFDHAVTVAEVAASIGAGLAKAALAGQVNGKLVDTSFLIENDSALAIVTEKSPEALDHSSLHRAFVGDGCAGLVSGNAGHYWACG